MKKLFVVLLSTLLAFGGFVAEAFAKSSSRVKGHIKKDGTYVAPHRKTNPDSSKFNNYGSKGNVNPYTGKKGTIDPLKK